MAVSRHSSLSRVDSCASLIITPAVQGYSPPVIGPAPVLAPRGYSGCYFFTKLCTVGVYYYYDFPDLVP